MQDKGTDIERATIMKNEITRETWIWDNTSCTVTQAGDLWEPGEHDDDQSFEAFAARIADEINAGAAAAVVCDRTVTIDEEHDGDVLAELFGGEIATNEAGFGFSGDTVAAGDRIDIWKPVTA